MQGRNNNNKNKILVVSVDYDACLAGVNFRDRFQAIQSLKIDAPDEYRKAYIHMLQEVHPVLMKDIVSKAKGFDELVIMIGSNRQTVELDQTNAAKNKNGSCFEGIPMLAEALKLQLGDEVAVRADLTVFGDALMDKPKGHHAAVFAGAEMGQISQAAVERVRKYKALIGDHKYCLSFVQMTTACLANSDAEVAYQFYDDLPGIIGESQAAFSSQDASACLPTNLISAQFNRYRDETASKGFLDLANNINQLGENAVVTPQAAMLVSRVGSVSLALAQEFNEYLSSTDIKNKLNESKSKKKTIESGLGELQKSERDIQAQIVAELRHNQDLRSLALELKLMLFRNFVRRDESAFDSSAFVDGLTNSLSLLNGDVVPADLFGLLADPNLRHTIQLIEDKPGFNDALNQFSQEYRKAKLALEGQSENLSKLNIAIDKLQAELGVISNILRFCVVVPEDSINKLATSLDKFNQLLRDKSVISLDVLRNLMEQISPLHSLLDQQSRLHFMKSGHPTQSQAIELGYGEVISSIQAIFEQHSRSLYLTGEDMLTSSDLIVFNRPLSRPVVCFDEQGHAESVMVKACTSEGIWANPPQLNILHENVQSAVVFGHLESVGAANKQNFLQGLTQLLGKHDCTKAVILGYFEEFKNRNGRFAFLHQQKNVKWDALRFKFKSKRHSGQDEHTFWHTDTYMKAIKMLKEAYLEKYDNTATEEQGQALLGYYRGNKIAKPAMTATQKQEQRRIQ